MLSSIIKFPNCFNKALTYVNGTGLKRTGKSCRLRWLNYLRPDVRRGNITLEEQLMILELHSRWGNRWSKIAQYLPGRTDNEIKNYWRTRVQKQAKQLKCEVNSKQFKDAMKYLWMPRLVERIQAEAATPAPVVAVSTSSATGTDHQQLINNNQEMETGQMVFSHDFIPSFTGDNNSSTAPSSESDSFGVQEYYGAVPVNNNPNPDYYYPSQVGYPESLIGPPSGYCTNGMDFQSVEQNTWLNGAGGDASDNFWNVDDFLFLQQQQINNNNNTHM